MGDERFVCYTVNKQWKIAQQHDHHQYLKIGSRKPSRTRVCPMMINQQNRQDNVSYILKVLVKKTSSTN